MVHLLTIFSAALVFAAIVPLAVIASHLDVGNRRRKLLRDLMESLPRLASLPFTELAAHKYDIYRTAGRDRSGRFRFDSGPEVIAVVLFVGLSGAFFGVTALLAGNPEILKELNVFLAGFGKGQSDAAYQAAAAKFYSIVFVVSYGYSVFVLLRSAADNALTSIHFIRQALQIVISVFLAYVLWPAIAAGLWPLIELSSNPSPATEWTAVAIPAGATALLTAAAILVGLHRGVWEAMIESWRWTMNAVRSMARTPDVVEPPEMPALSTLAGVDRSVEGLLGSRDVRDVLALATANPVQLFVETRLGLYQIIDMIGQAQLLNAVGDRRFRLLRDIGIRTIVDLASVPPSGHVSLATRALRILQGQAAPLDITPAPSLEGASPPPMELLQTTVNLIADDPFVHRLHQFCDTLQPKFAKAVGTSTASDGEIAGLEARVTAAITNALAPPSLTRYGGWVQVIVGAPDSSGRAEVNVRFFRQRPDLGHTAEVRIDEGVLADWVEFHLELKVGLQHRKTVKQTVQVPADGNSALFVLRPQHEPDMWLQIFQRNRLIQVVPLGADTAAANPSAVGSDSQVTTAAEPMPPARA